MIVIEWPGQSLTRDHFVLMSRQSLPDNVWRTTMHTCSQIIANMQTFSQELNEREINSR